jgi:hypothetical protein
MLKIIAGLMAALGVVAIIVAILGVERGDSVEAALQLLVSELVFAAIARLLDNTATIRDRLNHIESQLYRSPASAGGRRDSADADRRG